MKFLIPAAILVGSVAAQISNGDRLSLPVEPTVIQDTPSSIHTLEWATLTGDPHETPSLPLSSLPSDVTIITGTREPTDSGSMDTTMMHPTMHTSMHTIDMPGSPTGAPSSSAAGGEETSSPPSAVPSDGAGAVPTANAVAGLVALAGFAMAL